MRTTIQTLSISFIAMACHEANKAYCEAIGDNSQVPWDEAPGWQRDSAITGVLFTFANPGAPLSATHDSWMAEKVKDGWVYGPVKDPAALTHPCIVPYDQLPIEQKAKDAIFRGVARALLAE